MREPGDGQRCSRNAEEAVESTNGERDSGISGPSVPSDAVHAFRHRPILVLGDGVLLRWGLALSPSKAAGQMFP